MLTADQIAIYHNQTAVLSWLRSRGHHVRYQADLSIPKIHEPARRSFIGAPCPYCGQYMTERGYHGVTRDHKHPRSMGGKLHGSNRVIVCRRCNFEKANLTLIEYAEKLSKRGHLDRAVRVLDLANNDQISSRPSRSIPMQSPIGPTEGT